MKRNTLTTAVVAGLTGMAGMVSVSNAVNVNPEGMGQVLLYPYYSARGGNDTLISIVNTTDRGKAVKIRFIEAINSREVLDFNIYMSPYDVWTAAVTADAADGSDVKMVTSDTTCTVPQFPTGEQAFLNFEFAPTAAQDGGPTGDERMASGYIEVIEMGTLLEHPGVNETAPKATDANYVAWAVKHNSEGVPNNCQALVNAWTENAADDAVLGGAWLGDDAATGFDIQQGPSGGLFGAASIINVTEGTMFSYNATAIDGFYAFDSGEDKIFHTNPGTLAPSLLSGGATTSNIFDSGSVVSQDWSNSIFAVNAALMHDKLMNEYVTDATLGARTEWVVTFPTKKFHTDVLKSPFALEADDPIAPFTTTWHKTTDGWSFACEDLTFLYYDREEAPYEKKDEPEPDPDPIPPIVSPKPPVEDDDDEVVEDDPVLFQFCREANVIRFASDTTVPTATEILKEPARDSVLGYVNFGLPYTAGWVSLDLATVDPNSDVTTETRRMVASDNSSIDGLPALGFAVTTYTNGNVGSGVLANYGGTFAHRATRAVSASSLLD